MAKTKHERQLDDALKLRARAAAALQKAQRALTGSKQMKAVTQNQRTYERAAAAVERARTRLDNAKFARAMPPVDPAPDPAAPDA